MGWFQCINAAAAAYAVNKILGAPKSRKELIKFAMEGERIASTKAHADNVAASILGGFTVVRSYDPLDVFNIPYPEDLRVVIIFPQVEVKTSDAKKILKKEVKLSDAVKQWGNVAGLVSGLIQNDFERIGNSLQDVIIEPVRSILIPLYREMKIIALKAGALGLHFRLRSQYVLFCSKQRRFLNNYRKGKGVVWKKWN